MTQEVDLNQLDEIRRYLAEDEGIMTTTLNSEGQAVPTVGRIVHYESAIGDGVYSPAIVVRTKKSTVKEIINRWGPEPEKLQSKVDPNTFHETAPRPDSLVEDLPDDMTVDLLVHGLGKDYREYAVPYDPDGSPRTWRWPPRM